MTDSVLIWGALFIVAVADAREHRIPNSWLVFILVASSAESLLFLPENNLLVSLMGGLSLFAIGLFFYFVRAFAPGDVKLLGVAGFIVGWGELTQALYWIAIAAGLIGILFALLFHAAHPVGVSELYYRYKTKLLFHVYGASPRVLGERSDPLSEKVTMPFAPSVVVGLAMYNYF